MDARDGLRGAGVADLPSVRAAAAQLVLTLANSGYDAEPIVQQWLQSAKCDALSEVRNAGDFQAKSG
jgi:hypothetical protein